VREAGLREGLPVVVNPGIIDPQAFIHQVLNVRFPNPFMPDTPQRIACDTSQKIPIRFGETIKAYMAHETLRPADLRAIPLVLAAWCRYLLGVDDTGQPLNLSPDPMLPALQAALSGISLGDTGCAAKLRPILSDPIYFGVDLYEAGIGEAVEEIFHEMISGPGAVRRVLAQRYDSYPE